MTGLFKHACLSPGASQCARRQGLRTDRCPCGCHEIEVVQAAGDAQHLYHTEAAGYRGPSLSKLSRRADRRRLWLRFRAWVLSFFPTYCMGCNREVDLTTCGCGSPIDHSSWEGHSPRPMGCDCGRSE